MRTVQVVGNKTFDGIVYHYVPIGTVVEVSTLPHGGNEVVVIETESGIVQAVKRSDLKEVK